MPAQTLPNNQPMTLYNLISTLFTAKGNAWGFSALTLQTGTFMANPNLWTGLLPILSGVGMYLVSVWQKRKAEARAEELHAIQLAKEKADKKVKGEEAQLLLEIKEEQLESARLQNEILRAKLRAVEK